MTVTRPGAKASSGRSEAPAGLEWPGSCCCKSRAKNVRDTKIPGMIRGVPARPTADALLALAPPGAALGMPAKFVPWCAWAGVPLTLGQARLCRVCFDHAQPDPTNPVDVALFGDACSPVLAGALRLIALRLGRGSGKSHIAAAYGVFRMLTGDVSLCGPGDYPAVGVSSTDKGEAAGVLAKALAIVRGRPVLERMLRDQNATGFALVRPDGTRVRFVTRVTTAKGKGARGPSWLMFVIDEAEFVDPSGGDSTARVADLAASAAPRVLPGGAVILCSTPWPAESYVSKLFDENFAHPLHALCAFGPTLMLRDEPEIRAERDKLMASDPAQALREYDCVITDVSGAFFEASSVDAAVSATTPRARFQRVSAGIDLAFVSDGSAAVHTERQIVGAKMMLVVTHVDFVDPRVEKKVKAGQVPGRDPESALVVPSAIIGKFVTDARDACATALVADGHYIQSVREHASSPEVAMQVVAAPMSPAEQSAADVYLRDLFRESLVLLPNDPRIVGQLKSVLAKAQPGGLLRAQLPRRAGSGHADLFVALRNAAWHDRRHGPLLRGQAIATGGTPQVFAAGWTVE